VAFTYNDAVIFLEYAIDMADACRARGIRAVAVTAGYVNPEPGREFFAHLDAANVDLKGFTEAFYHDVCAGHLAALRILPIAVGRATPGEVAGVLGAVGRQADLVVVSTDLSHYEDLASARAHDRRTADAILALDADAIGPWDACGDYALRAALAFARAATLQIRLLDLRTSGDTAGEPQRVVGYGAFAISSGSEQAA
jgi:hypothetical protein